MKEQITLRLYRDTDQPARCQAGAYLPGEDVRGWDYARGEQIALTDAGGGFLYAIIDKVDTEAHADDTGTYKLATAWTQD